MTKSEYLFGVEPCYFKGKEFYDVARERIEFWNKILEETKEC